MTRQDTHGLIHGNAFSPPRCKNGLRSRYYFLLIILILAACTPQPTPTPIPTDTNIPTATSSPTLTHTPTQTFTPSPTPDPEWYQELDESYSVMEYRYGTVTDPSARRYATLEDALAGNGNYDRLSVLPAFVAIVGEESRAGRTFYQFNVGWMEAARVQLLVPSPFRGILLTREVAFRFGWVLEDTTSVNADGTPIQDYHRYQVVHEVPAVTE